MPLIDKPLAELKTYQGLNPRPADFDAYWTAALKELDATDPKPDLVPSKDIHPRNSEALLTCGLTGVGGARVYAKYIRPKKSSGKNPAVLRFTATRASSGDFVGRLAYSERVSAWRRSIAAVRVEALRGCRRSEGYDLSRTDCPWTR